MTDRNISDDLDADAGPVERPRAKGGRPRKVAPAPANKLRRAGRSANQRPPRFPQREQVRTEQDRVNAPAERLYRKSRRTVDAFFVDQKIIPKGMSYEWKAETVFGRPENAHQIDLRENHWKPVPSTRHPELCPDGYEGPIRQGGQILMERPDYLTKEALKEGYVEAREQLTGQEQAVKSNPGDGEFEREHVSVERRTQGIKKSYEPFIIPD